VAGGAEAAGPDDSLFGYIERFASVLVSAGFPPMPARVFGSARRPCPAGCGT